MKKYVIAVNRAKPNAALDVEVVRRFPGIRLVEELNPRIVTVEATPATITKFRRQFGNGFLIEQPIARAVPDLPFSDFAKTTAH